MHQKLFLTLSFIFILPFSSLELQAASFAEPGLEASILSTVAPGNLRGAVSPDGEDSAFVKGLWGYEKFGHHVVEVHLAPSVVLFTAILIWYCWDDEMSSRLRYIFTCGCCSRGDRTKPSHN